MHDVKAVIIVAADAEWLVVTGHYGVQEEACRPYDHFLHTFSGVGGSISVEFVHSGCGKVPAAATTQYAIDTWHPSLVVNLGTCGGMDPLLGVGDIVTAEKTVIYDLCERSGGQEDMVRRYTTDLMPIASLPNCILRCGTIITADQDVDPAQVEQLRATYGAIAADWESGAVAHVAHNINHVKCGVLKVVSDIVSSGGSAIYAQEAAFENCVAAVVPGLLHLLPLLLMAHLYERDARRCDDATIS
ncbi:MAG: 5'-methylthioadenosine/S-adenosylhomocysteine nucleosidase [Verrucomicrobia bacterium]|nr:5'-methylthioadenosine/S-adenosylhomocysteine nucleosidase [Verrucomicrobiota bacterium]